MVRRNITYLKGFSIRDVKDVGTHLALKLHSKADRKTIWITVSFDCLFDQDGNFFNNNAEYVPPVEAHKLGIR